MPATSAWNGIAACVSKRRPSQATTRPAKRSAPSVSGLTTGTAGNNSHYSQLISVRTNSPSGRHVRESSKGPPHARPPAHSGPRLFSRRRPGLVRDRRCPGRGRPPRRIAFCRAPWRRARERGQLNPSVLAREPLPQMPQTTANCQPLDPARYFRRGHARVEAPEIAGNSPPPYLRGDRRGMRSESCQGAVVPRTESPPACRSGGRRRRRCARRSAARHWRRA
jgi:hypothetical protein